MVSYLAVIMGLEGWGWGGQSEYNSAKNGDSNPQRE